MIRPPLKVQTVDSRVMLSGCDEASFFIRCHNVVTINIFQITFKFYYYSKLFIIILNLYNNKLTLVIFKNILILTIIDSLPVNRVFDYIMIGYGDEIQH